MADDTDTSREHNADLWAMSYGFRDAADMQAEVERMERERLYETPKKSAEGSSQSGVI